MRTWKLFGSKFTLKTQVLCCYVLWYRHPNSSKHLYNNFEEKFDNVLTTTAIEHKETLLLGDINCGFLKRSDHKTIKEILKLNCLKQVLKCPNRITNNTKTLIDIITTTREDRIENHIVVGNSISDHDFTCINRQMNCKTFKPRRIITRNYTKYDKEAYQTELTISFSFLNDVTILSRCKCCTEQV